MSGRIYDRETIEPLARSLFELGEPFQLTVTGGSMLPFLAPQRDTVLLSPPARRPRRGDILLFTREDGSWILHRVRRVKKDGLYMIGDAQTVTEGPVPESRVLATVTRARIKGRIVTPKSPRWIFYRTV